MQRILYHSYALYISSIPITDSSSYHFSIYKITSILITFWIESMSLSPFLLYIYIYSPLLCRFDTTDHYLSVYLVLIVISIFDIIDEQLYSHRIYIYIYYYYYDYYYYY